MIHTADRWEFKRLKYLFTKKTSGAWGEDPEDENAIVCIRAADFETEKLEHKKSDLTRRAYKQADINSKGLEKNDIIIEKSGGGENQPVGRIVLFNLEEKALCSNFLEVLRPDKKIVSPQFIAYVMYSIWQQKLVTSVIKQTTGIQNLDISDYLDFKIKLPSLKEQNKIVQHIKRETAYIDNLIKQKQNLLALLSEKRQAEITQTVTKGLNPNAKMKDSGINWLGEIPEHWEVKKFKYLTTKIGSGVTPKGGAEIYQKEGIPLLRSQNVHFNGLRLDDVAFISEDIHNSMSNSKVLKGDVLLNITGASIGRCYYYDGEYDEANVNQHVCILRPNKIIMTKYLSFYLSSDLGQYQISVSQVGGGREGLTFESLKSFIIPLPNEIEQSKILDYISKTVKQIDNVYNATQNSIDLLKERRAALITAAVTGQMEIS